MTRTGSIKGIRVLGAETTLTAVGNTTETGTLELHELSTNGQHKVSISAPNSLSADYSLTLPGDDGDADQVLTTDGSGILTWEDQSGGGGDGDITGVTAGVGLSGGGASGGVTLTVDISEFSDVTPANGDKLLTLDSDGSTEQLTTVAGLATLFAGDGLAASSAVLSLDLKSNGGAVIESNELAIDLAASSITGTLAVGDGGTGQTTLNNLITLGTHTTGNYVATIADSGTGGITVANSGAESAAVTLEMDVHGLTTAAIASGDFIAFSDEGESGDPSRKETIDDIATLFAGDGLAASSAVMSVEDAQTTITSIYNAGLKIGRDAHNLIDFATTDDEVIFRIANVDEIKMVANALVPVTSDGAALGTTSLMWQDLFLASGAVINFNNGDVTLTHSGNALTVGGGNLAATISTATQGTIDHDSLANFVANKHIDHSSVSVIAGTGLTGGGTIASDRTLNVIGGDGITANANDMAITAAQTTITSIYNAGLKIGRDAHNLIDFATTDDEVIFRIANVDEIKMVANALVPVTSDGAALGTTSLMWQDLFLASGAVINFNNGDVTLTHTSNTLTVAGGNLAATISTATQGTIDHDSLANFVANKHIDHSSVSVIAGTGLTGGGTIASDRTLNVIGGDGITANANDMAITAAQTTITSIYNAGLKIGRDAHNLIDFATTDDEVIFRIANVDEIKMVANALVPVTSDGAALGTTSLMWQDLFLASGAVINFNNGDVTLTHTSNTLTVAGGNLAATISTATQGTIDHDSLANFVANKHIDHSSVSVIAGTGLTGGGTIASDRTLNVIGGDGITANANDMAITAAQTTITSIYNAGLKIGRDAHNLIDFATTDDEVIFRIANVDEIKMVANALVPVTSDGAALGTTSLMWQDLFLASGAVINFNNGDVTLTHTSNTLTVAGGNLAATISTATQGTIDHDSLANFVANEHIDHTSVSVIAGDGLTGGGTIAANRTFAVGAGTGIDVAADAISVDVSDFMANGANNRIVTATGTDAMNAEANLTFDGSALSLTGTLTVGVDDTGHDVKFYGATSGRFLLWDESHDRLKFRDNVKAVFGLGNDLEIYHDGSNSYIDDTGTGTLKYRSGTQTFTNADSSKTMAIFNAANSVDLYYNNSKKFETTNTGVEITGNLTTTGNILPSSSDGGTLGSVSLMWSDLFLASGGVIHWHDGTGEVTITHSANTIAITSGYGSEVCALTVEGDITAFSSDKRLKKNIEIIENPLQKIDKLSGFIYDWDLKKCDEVGFNPKDEKQIGVFAQDVKEVIPEAVKPAPFDTKDGISISGDNYLTVQYEKIVPLLIESIKEQQKQIDILRNEIEILKN